MTDVTQIKDVNDDKSADEEHFVKLDFVRRDFEIELN